MRVVRSVSKMECLERDTFKLLVMAAENAHRPETEIVKIFECALKPEIFCEEIYSHTFETLVGAMAETSH